MQYFVEHDLDILFTLPLSQVAVKQLEQPEQLITLNNLDETQNDQISYCWGSANYSSNKACQKNI